MKLLEMLQTQMETEESYFRKALLKEDVARIATMIDKAKAAGSEAAFLKDGMFIGWTNGDLRTPELKETLEPLMQAVYARLHGDEVGDDDVLARWHDFSAQRMKVLIHCL